MIKPILVKKNIILNIIKSNKINKNTNILNINKESIIFFNLLFILLIILFILFLIFRYIEKKKTNINNIRHNER